MPTNPLIFTKEVSVPTGASWLSRFFAEEGADSLLEGATHEFVQSGVVVYHCELHGGVHKSHALELMHYVAQFNAVFLEESAASGRVEEQVLHHKVCSRSADHGFLCSNLDSETVRRVPILSSRRIVRMSICATAAMEARASPRNPMVWRL